MLIKETPCLNLNHLQLFRLSSSASASSKKRLDTIIQPIFLLLHGTRFLLHHILPRRLPLHIPSPRVLLPAAEPSTIPMLTMPPSHPIQDRTPEFRAILREASHRLKSAPTSQRQSLLAASSGQRPPTPAQRSEFARRAAEIGRGITGTMAKLERLTQLARRKTLFDDRPVEINELTFVIKQDLTQLDRSIKELQALSAASLKGAAPVAPAKAPAAQESEHNKNVVFMLRAKLSTVGATFKETLETRTKNVQASRSRTENFLSSVGAAATPPAGTPGRTDSPLYQSQAQQQGQQGQGFTVTKAAQADILSLDPSSSASALTRNQPSAQQLLLMEEGSNTYIQQRGEQIDMIERTMMELGGLFTQLAEMVSVQGEQIQRIDADTEDTLDNVEGAQRELTKYWNRVSGNRWLIAKMFGVLMIFFLLWVLVAG
jgi:syntaxin 5